MASKHYLWKFIAAVSLAFGLSAISLHAADIGGETHDHGNSPAKLTLNNGKKWETDEALRKGMDMVRTTMKSSLYAIHQGKFSNAEYDKLSQEIGREVSFIVANCKLEAKADAQLHLIITEIMDGTEVMAGKVVNLKRQEGAVKVLDALNNYASYFNHPDWESINH